MILWAFLIGMTLCGLTLVLITADDSSDKFASAVAAFCGWCAFGMLILGASWGIGLVIPGLIGALVLILRHEKIGARISPLAPYKMPLGIASLISSVVMWLGVLNKMEGLPNG